MPNSGHNELIPPSGSFTPCHRKYPQAPTISALVARIDGYQLVRPKGLYTCQSASCNMNRATREHDGEVVPQRHQRFAAQAVRKDMRYAHGKCVRAASPVEERL